MEVRDRSKKAGNMICIDRVHFKSLHLLKNSLKFRKYGTGKEALLGHMSDNSYKVGLAGK